MHNIYVAEVGKWLAWDPNPNDVQEQEYAEDQLNELMRAYKKNEDDREQFYANNPEARAAKGQKRGIRTEKEIMSVVGPSDEKVEGSSNEVVSAGGQYAGLFDGPADLALQRKMERKDKKEDSA